MSDTEITITIDRDELTGALDALDYLGTNPGEALLAAGRAVKEYLVQYHTDFEDKWRGDHYMAGPKSGEWEQQIPLGWQDPELSGQDSVSIQNTHPHFAQKVLGGTIEPRSAGALTIPLVPEAKGVLAREFPEPLFHPKGTNVLATKDGHGFIPVYALVQSVTQEPWPGAMPEGEAIADVFQASFLTQLDAALDAATAGGVAA